MLQAHQTVVNLGSSMRYYFPIMEGVRHHAPSQHIPPTLSFRETCLRSAAVSRKPMPFIALEFCFHRQLTCTPASHALLFKTVIHGYTWYSLILFESTDFLACTIMHIFCTHTYIENRTHIIWYYMHVYICIDKYTRSYIYVCVSHRCLGITMHQPVYLESEWK